MFALSTCIESILSVNVSANTIDFNLAPPSSQTELTGLVTRFASQTSNFTDSIKIGTTRIEKTYDIYSQLYMPAGFSSGIVEFAIHGHAILSTISGVLLIPMPSSVNFDHSYWTIGGSGSQYSYVESALQAGHAIFIYDRLSKRLALLSVSHPCANADILRSGVGKSSKPDGIKEVQISTEVEVAARLVDYLRGDSHSFKFTKVIGVGHSFGR